MVFCDISAVFGGSCFSCVWILISVSLSIAGMNDSLVYILVFVLKEDLFSAPQFGIA